MAETCDADEEDVRPVLENGVAFRLQHSLIELIDLGLHAKQAHWNVIGSNFRPLHAQFDEITEMARSTADEVCRAAGCARGHPDGTLWPSASRHSSRFRGDGFPGPRPSRRFLARLDHLARMNRNPHRRDPRDRPPSPRRSSSTSRASSTRPRGCCARPTGKGPGPEDQSSPSCRPSATALCPGSAGHDGSSRWTRRGAGRRCFGPIDSRMLRPRPRAVAPSPTRTRRLPRDPRAA
jgi:hypothetical protein